MKKILKRLFKRQQKPTVYKKKFLYTIEKDDIVNDYVYEFETVEAVQNDKMLRQCYDEFVRRHGEAAVDYVVNVAIV